MDPILIGKVLVTVGYMVFEYWLGKADKVKAGSTVEVLVNVVKAFKPKAVAVEPPKTEEVPK